MWQVTELEMEMEMECRNGPPGSTPYPHPIQRLSKRIISEEPQFLDLSIKKQESAESQGMPLKEDDIEETNEWRGNEDFHYLNEILPIVNSPQHQLSFVNYNNGNNGPSSFTCLCGKMFYKEIALARHLIRKLGTMELPQLAELSRKKKVDIAKDQLLTLNKVMVSPPSVRIKEEVVSPVPHSTPVASPQTCRDWEGLEPDTQDAPMDLSQIKEELELEMEADTEPIHLDQQSKSPQHQSQPSVKPSEPKKPKPSQPQQKTMDKYWRNVAGHGIKLLIPVGPEQGKFLCFCDKLFDKFRSLQAHFKRMTLNRNFPCPRESCGKTYTVKSNLNMHIQAVHDKIPVVCKLCGHKMKYITQMTTHQRSKFCRVPGESASPVPKTPHK